MKLIMALIMCLAAFTAKAQNDTMNQRPQTQEQRMDTTSKVSCAIIDANTLACFSATVDADNDGIVGADEWNNADVADKGILELENIYDENEVFESEGVYDYDGLYEPGLDDYEYGTDDGLGTEDEIDTDDYNRNEVDIFDEDEDGAFE